MTAETAGESEAATYTGLFGAFPYAFRASESRFFRSYVVVGGLLALLVSVLFLLGLVGVVAQTTGGTGGVFTFSRAFFLFVGLLVVFPLLAPVLSVARRHRRVGSDARSDAVLAAAGYLFVLSLYVGLVASIPPEQQEPVSGVLAPVVTLLYGAPPAAGLVPPAVGAALIYLVHRRTR